MYLKLYLRVSVYFMMVNKKQRLERVTLRMVVHKLILRMKVSLE